MAKKIDTTPEAKAYLESVEKIAGNIKSLADAVAGLLNGPLKKKALVILLAHSSGQSQKSVEAILDSLESLHKDWLNR
jgi:hypothetical protein